MIWSKKFRKRACIFQIAKLPHFSIFPNLDFGGTPLKNSEIISANFILIVLMNIQTGRFQKEILKNMKKHPEKSKILRKVSEIAPFARSIHTITITGISRGTLGSSLCTYSYVLESRNKLAANNDKMRQDGLDIQLTVTANRNKEVWYCNTEVATRGLHLTSAR